MTDSAFLKTGGRTARVSVILRNGSPLGSSPACVFSSACGAGAVVWFLAVDFHTVGFAGSACGADAVVSTLPVDFQTVGFVCFSVVVRDDTSSAAFSSDSGLRFAAHSNWKLRSMRPDSRASYNGVCPVTSLRRGSAPRLRRRSTMSFRPCSTAKPRSERPERRRALGLRP